MSSEDSASCPAPSRHPQTCPQGPSGPSWQLPSLLPPGSGGRVVRYCQALVSRGQQDGHQGAPQNPLTPSLRAQPRGSGTRKRLGWRMLGHHLISLLRVMGSKVPHPQLTAGRALSPSRQKKTGISQELIPPVFQARPAGTHWAFPSRLLQEGAQACTRGGGHSPTLGTPALPFTCSFLVETTPEPRRASRSMDTSGCRMLPAPGDLAEGGRQVEKEGLNPHHSLPVPPIPGGRGLHMEKPGLAQVRLGDGRGGGPHMHKLTAQGPHGTLLRATEPQRSPEALSTCSPGHTGPLSSAHWAPGCCFSCWVLLPAWLSPAAPQPQ